MAIEGPNHITPSFDPTSSCDKGELRDFFADSYQRAGYLGDERFFAKLSEADGVVSLRHKVSKGLAAASLVNGNRITMIGTSTDIPHFGRRLNSLTHLFTVTPIVSSGSWISISGQEDRVQLAAHNANYFREGNGNTVERLLEEFGASDNYTIFYDDNLIPVIARKRETAGMPYPQQIWRSNAGSPDTISG